VSSQPTNTKTVSTPSVSGMRHACLNSIVPIAAGFKLAAVKKRKAQLLRYFHEDF
jgi:hypothetical protein